MDNAIMLYWIMVSVFVSYVGAVRLIFGKQPSISASYDCWPGLWKSLFIFFCWGFAFPAIVAGITVTPLMFFAGIGIMFVGAAYEIKIPWVKHYHMIFAISGIIFSQLAIYFGYKMPEVNVTSLALTGLILLLTIKKNKEFRFWFIELVAFGAICYAMWPY
jgi:hypothetical protein